MKLNPIYITVFLFTLILSGSSIMYSQQEEIAEEEEVAEQNTIKQIISISELVSLLNSPDKECIISDYEIISTDNDKAFLIDKVFFSLYQISPSSEKSKKIYFYNCDFNLSNNTPLKFTNWQLTKLNVVGCQFNCPLEFENFPHSREQLLFENCIFKNDVDISNKFSPANKLNFRNCKFYSTLNIDVSLENLNIEDCNFIADDKIFSEKDEEGINYQLSISDKNIGNLTISSSRFDNNGNENIFSINLGNTNLGNVLLDSIRLQVLNLSSSNIEKSLMIDSLFVEKYIGILNFDFPEKNTNSSWSNLGGEKLAVFWDDKYGTVNIFQAKTDAELSNNLVYNDLMSAYNKFNTLYHDRGDIRSANASYVEIKDIETRKQKFEQSVNPSFNNLINYKLNIFLKYFSDYATNPGKSLIQSLWVLLGFTFLYMLTFSAWDGMNYKYYVSQLGILAKYVGSQDSLKKVLENDRELNSAELGNYSEIDSFFDYYQKNGKRLPHLLKLFGGTLTFVGKIRLNFISRIIHALNFQPKAWESLETIEKFWSGLIILLISLCFIAYVFIVKFVNSLILSLNSFVVIGFGSLPEQENSLAMYLSIIEGIIGWFLLTIFTITLFSQVLQNA